MFKLLFVISAITGVFSDDYLQESETYCKQSQDLVSCGKYRVLRYLDRVSDTSVLTTNATFTPVKLVRIEDPDVDGTFFPESKNRAMDDGEISRFFKFAQQRADRFLRTQGIEIPLPDGFRMIDSDNNVVEARANKKTKGLISLLTLFGVFKVKVLAGLILLGIFFIKKVILLGALILPTVLHNIKMGCKHIVPYHATTTHVTHADDYHHDDGSYGGHSGFGGYGPA